MQCRVSFPRPVQAGAQVAEFLGTDHHEFHFTVQEGIDAISEVIYHIETFDVTTVSHGGGGAGKRAVGYTAGWAHGGCVEVRCPWLQARRMPDSRPRVSGCRSAPPRPCS